MSRNPDDRWVERIMAYENGELSFEQEVQFFQDLLDAGLWQSMQGHYQRMVYQLIDEGFIKEIPQRPPSRMLDIPFRSPRAFYVMGSAAYAPAILVMDANNEEFRAYTRACRRFGR